MYPRSTTFQAQPESIDEGIAYVRDDVRSAASSMGGLHRPVDDLRPRVRQMRRRGGPDVECPLGRAAGSQQSAARAVTSQARVGATRGG